MRVIIIFFKLVCANFSLCESFPLAIQLASSPPLHLFLFPSRCRAVFSCCRCFCVQPQIILSKTLSPIFLHPQRVFFLCAFSPAAAPPLPSSSNLFFFLVASSVFTMLLVIMRFVKFKERTTFGLQHHRLSVLVVMQGWGREGGSMANKLPNLRQQQVDLVRTFEKKS